MSTRDWGVAAVSFVGVLFVGIFTAAFIFVVSAVAGGSDQSAPEPTETVQTEETMTDTEIGDASMSMAWDDMSVYDQASICEGYKIDPAGTIAILRDGGNDQYLGYDQVRGFLDVKCYEE